MTLPSDSMVRFGWTPEQSTGIVNRLMKESGGDPTNVGDGGLAYGLAQWHPDRQAKFREWAGHDIRQSTTQEQLAYVDYEMRQGQEQKAGRAVASAPDASTAERLFTVLDERPASSAAAGLGIGAGPFNEGFVQGNMADLRRLYQEKADKQAPIFSQMQQDVSRDRLRFDKMAENYKPFEPTQAPPPPNSDPLQAFGSVAGVFAMIAAGFSHTPAIAAMNGMAGAINSAHDRDWENYSVHYKQWKDNTQLMIENHKLQADDMRQALEMMQTDITTGTAMAKAVAVQTDDQIALKMLESGQYEKLASTQIARQQLADQMQKTAIQVEEAHRKMAAEAPQQAVAEASAELQQANAGGDPAKIAAASAKLDAALSVVTKVQRAETEAKNSGVKVGSPAYVTQQIYEQILRDHPETSPGDAWAQATQRQAAASSKAPSAVSGAKWNLLTDEDGTQFLQRVGPDNKPQNQTLSGEPYTPKHAFTERGVASQDDRSIKRERLAQDRQKLEQAGRIAEEKIDLSRLSAEERARHDQAQEEHLNRVEDIQKSKVVNDAEKARVLAAENQRWHDMVADLRAQGLEQGQQKIDAAGRAQEAKQAAENRKLDQGDRKLDLTQMSVEEKKRYDTGLLEHGQRLEAIQNNRLINDAQKAAVIAAEKKRWDDMTQQWREKTSDTAQQNAVTRRALGEGNLTLAQQKARVAEDLGFKKLEGSHYTAQEKERHDRAMEDHAGLVLGFQNNKLLADTTVKMLTLEQKKQAEQDRVEIERQKMEAAKNKEALRRAESSGTIAGERKRRFDELKENLQSSGSYVNDTQVYKQVERDMKTDKDPQFSAATAKFLAQSILSGDARAAVGLTRNPSLFAQVENEMALQAADTRMDGAGLTRRKAEMAAYAQGVKAFEAGGKLEPSVRSLDVVVAHLGTLTEAAKELASTGAITSNWVVNEAEKQFGGTGAVTFDAMKGIVAAEIEKAVSGSAGAVSDREDLKNSLKAALDAPQLAKVIAGYEALMTGQLKGYEGTYDRLQGIGGGQGGNFREKFLQPDTRRVLAREAGSGNASSRPRPAGKSDAQLMQEAKDAIAKNAPRQGVVDQMKAWGLDASGL